MRYISYRQAINEALTEEMERDDRVFVYGIDVADHKRIFGSTVGLLEKFGPERCFSTPLCEEALVGFGLGAALSGLKPVNVHIRVDFLLLAMNQLANMVSSWRYGTSGKVGVPLVIRAVIGKGWGQSYQHSKSLQSIFAHVPGLKVVMPTTPTDAKGLLKSAIQDEDPVIIIEHRLLYDVMGDIPDPYFEEKLGKARTLRSGEDLTIISTSYMGVEALHASRILESRGISVEVIDPRTIIPLDKGAIVKSVKKTGRCIVADYDWTFCGFSAEVAALISKECFGILKSPVERIGFASTPCPSARALEDVFYPNARTLVRAVESMLNISPTDLSQEVFYSYENAFKGPF